MPNDLLLRRHPVELEFSLTGESKYCEKGPRRSVNNRVRSTSLVAIIALTTEQQRNEIASAAEAA